MVTDFFEINILYQTTSMIEPSLDNDDDDEVMKKIRFTDDGGEFKTDMGYFDLQIDPVMKLIPRYLCSKDGTTKKYFTEIIFESEQVAYAVGKPDSVLKKLKDYMESLPDPEKE